MLEAAKQRTEALMLANRAMHESLSTLSDAHELDGLLGGVLTTIVKRLSEENGALWLHDYEADLTYLHMNFQAGAVKFRKDTDHPGREGKSNTVQHKNNLLCFERNEPMQFPMDQIRVDPEWSEFVDYFETNEVKAVVVIPLFAGERYLGNNSIRAQHREAFPAEEIAFAQALANQASLALHIARLAEEAKQAAVAREQEKAALEHVAELAKANDALRHSVDSLVDLDSIDGFLSVSLRTIAEVLEVPSACFWKTDREYSYLQLIFEKGKIVRGQESNHPYAHKPTRHEGGFSFDADGKLKLDPFLSLVDDPGCPFTEVQLEMLRVMDVRALINIPVVLKGESVATITARLTRSMPDPTPARLELIRALANQAALALQMSELAEAARQAAIAREEERAARKRALESQAANEALQKTIDAAAALVTLSIATQIGWSEVGYWRAT